MATLTFEQLELLQRAREGRPMWGGSAATDQLSREVGLLLSLCLLEPAREVPYRLTPRGAITLELLRTGGLD
jgi:hypothetical protein